MSVLAVPVVLLAAGAGTRLGAGRPKALRRLAGEPLVVHAARRLRECPSVGALVCVAPVGLVEEVARLLLPWEALVVEGGAERQDSVAAGLVAVGEAEHVLVHDAARAFVPVQVVEDVVAALRDGADAVLPVLPVADTLKRVDVDGAVVTTVPRSDLRLAQTPQGFRRAVLDAAHRSAPRALTDDAALVEAIGTPVRTVAGSCEALKVTTPFDLLVAEAVLVGRAGLGG